MNDLAVMIQAFFVKIHLIAREKLAESSGVVHQVVFSYFRIFDEAAPGVARIDGTPKINAPISLINHSTRTNKK